MTTNLKIDGARLWDTLMETARFGATAKGGIRRLTLSAEDRAVRDWLAAACHAEGLAVTVDEVGNMFATRPGTAADALAIAFGSHLDTQPAGGKFDGVLGVLAGLEAIRTLNAAGYATTRPLTLVNWTNEEGARFAPAMTGSGLYAGELDGAAIAARTDREGVSFAAALAAIDARGSEPLGARRFAAFVELHIEQGPVLEAEGATLGIVTGGQGLSWFDARIAGRDSHAGTTPMTMRRDALMAAAELALAVERIALDHAPAGVATVGEVDVLPGSRNTIPGTVAVKADIRHPDETALDAMEAAVRASAAAIATRREVEIALAEVWRKPPLSFHPVVVEAVAAAAEASGLPSRRIVSGAGHDAFCLASTCPTGMIFVPCTGGISHNEEESATEGDCAAGAQILLDTLLRLDASPDL